MIFNNSHHHPVTSHPLTDFHPPNPTLPLSCCCCACTFAYGQPHTPTLTHLRMRCSSKDKGLWQSSCHPSAAATWLSSLACSAAATRSVSQRPSGQASPPCTQGARRKTLSFHRHTKRHHTEALAACHSSPLARQSPPAHKRQDTLQFKLHPSYGVATGK